MDKVIRGKSKEPLRARHLASERTSHWTLFLAQPVWGRREKGREKRGEGVRERDSTFSLDFSAIGASNPGEIRGKVDPHRKSYAWVPVLWSFDKSER